MSSKSFGNELSPYILKKRLDANYVHEKPTALRIAIALERLHEIFVAHKDPKRAALAGINVGFLTFDRLLAVRLPEPREEFSCRPCFKLSKKGFDA